MNKFNLLEVDNDAKWDDVVEKSPQGTLFCSSLYLASICSRYRRFFIYLGPYEVKAALVFIESSDGKKIILDEMVVYSGLMFCIDKNQKKASSYAERLKITEFVIKELTGQYSSVELALSISFEDMRPFIWYINSCRNIKSHIGISLRYTSHIDISELMHANDDMQTDIFLNLERRRRRYLKDYRKSMLYSTINKNPEVLIKNYKSTLSQQGKNVSDTKLQCMTKIIKNLIEVKSGFLLEIIENKRPVYSIFFGYNKTFAYAMFAAGDSEKTNSMAGAAAYWEGFCYLAKNIGITMVDLEGINSPKGGEFKLGFGGDIKQYFDVTL